jgi:hypothetical protein
MDDITPFLGDREIREALEKMLGRKKRRGRNAKLTRFGEG